MKTSSNLRLTRQARMYVPIYGALLLLNFAWGGVAVMAPMPNAVYLTISIALLALALLQGCAVLGISRWKHHYDGIWTGSLMALIPAMALAVEIAHA